MKKDLQTGWLLMASLGMELSWRLAWAVMLMVPIAHRMFPVTEAIIIFVSAIGITRLVNGRGWPAWAVFAIQGFGCASACILLVHVYCQSHSFLSPNWIHSIFDLQKKPTEWVVLALTILFAPVFWFGGMALARRSSEYLLTCKCFDTGAGMLLGLFVMKIVIVHDRALIPGPIMVWLIALFFIFGSMAIGVARQDGHASRTFIKGYRIQGLLISVAITILILGIVLSTALWPYLNAMAETGYGFFKSGTQALGPVIITVMNFMKQNNRARGDSAASGDFGVSGPDKWGENLLMIFLWGLGAIGIIIAAVALGIGLWHFFKWFFSKTATDPGRARQSGRFRAWLLRLWVFLFLCWEWMAQYIRNYNTIGRIYRALLSWGKFSGIPCYVTETPLEFSQRLIRYIPAAQAEISVISDLFQKEIYAGQHLNVQQFNQARVALQRLRSPALWIPRIRLWFLEG